MLKRLFNFTKRQTVIVAGTLIVLMAMVISLQSLLSQGHKRALAEQSLTSATLAYAVEDSVIRSMQAAVGALETLAANVLHRPPHTLNTLKDRLLRGLPQLRSVDFVALEKATQCTQRVSNMDTLFLTPQQGRFWGDPINRAELSYWPICVPYRLQGEIVGYVIGSVNLNYYKSLFQSLSSSHREASLYLFTGETILGEEGALTEQRRAQIMARSWGEVRDQNEKGAYLDSYRATSFYPLVISLRSYDQDALENWRNDAQVVRTIFAALALALLLMLGMYLVFKHKRDKVQGDNHLLSMAIRSAANAIFITDPKGHIEWVNEAFTNLTGYSQKEVHGRTPRVLNSGVHEQPFFQDLWRSISQGLSWRNELVNRHKNGQLITVEQTITPILDNKGRVSYFIAVHEDITTRKEAEQQVLYMAQHDDLTGLANRRYFEQCLEECVAKRQYGSIVLMFIDLDRFKEINDTLGHDAGDVLLKRVAKKLRGVMPDEALLSRLGGDEFAVFLHPAGNEAQIHYLAQSIVNAIAQPFEYKNTSFSVSCSVGVAMTGVEAVDVSSLLRQADLAMYRAKHSGKNTYRFFDESMDESMQHRVATQRYLEQALSDSEQLQVYFQPQIDSRDGALYGAEVLVRWCRQGQWISPGEFIPIAEDSGQIIELGRWIMEAALRQLADWRARHVHIGKLSLNFSAVQLSNSDVAMELIEALKRHAIPASEVTVEFTETTLMVRSAQLERNLNLLREHAIAIAIDDFGTGYCSLSYLRELQAHYLKIDQSFIRGIGNNDSDDCIVAATIAMAKGLHMEVVAEGVETEAQTSYLTHLGCQYLQGFGFAAPMSAANLEAWLAQTKTPSERKALESSDADLAD
ncbi:Cyclic di-GMP phosphodiesterase Gmr [Marinomonas aquimarina]|uniref:Cyclic di-GMP phosphodiesterase Gmr n=1 Tax=Marinomonas aquimarina TaxID=295068 RepID=A0A1A8TIX5_9GAMM|nr:EAL domain-containing protein [Marinomonas aquimarina]SBS32741.1 Cyclic di-GMP phosphodiesterase Gmr [Marinomonas aquimarina]